MRSAPNERAEVVSQALYGERVRVLAAGGNWLAVRTGDGYAGWVPSNATDAAPEAGPVRMVTALLEPLRSSADEGADPITLLPIGSLVDVLGDAAHGRWTVVMGPAGGAAYVRTDALADPPRPATAIEPTNLAATAKRFIGVPYLWGGRSPFGTDCSGFTQMVFGLCGAVLPRDACMQAAWVGAVPVEVDTLSIGDLLFFGGDEDPRKRGITHVGMALEPPAFIHAAGGIGVTISSLNDSAYARIFRSAARVRAVRP
jgi:cell wall-associated NlpC family hydrolase